MRTQIVINKYSYVKNQSDTDTYDVFIDGDIVDADTQQWMAYWGIDTSTSYKSFRDSILNCGCNNINIHINSGGGMVSDALAMGDFIKEQRAAGKNIKTYGKGIIASAATYPLMAAGKDSHISKNAFFMIHNVSGGGYGTVDEMESIAKMMRKFNDCVRDEYAATTGKPKETISAWMNAETWFTGTEACDNGFVKNCTANENVLTNSISNEKWPFKNMAILNTINSSIKPLKNKGMKKNTIINAIDQAFKKYFSGTTNLANAKPDDLKTAITDAISAQEDDDVDPATITNAVNAAMTGDAFQTAITNGIKKLLEATDSPVNAAITTATNGLVKQEALDKVVKDITDKLGSSNTKKVKNSTVETEPDGVAEMEGWNR